MSTSVYVVDNTGTPLLPTCPSRARLLLKRGKVTVYSVIPFTVQLVKTVENPVGEFEVGIDDGAKTVGVSVKGNNIQEHSHRVINGVVYSSIENHIHRIDGGSHEKETYFN